MDCGGGLAKLFLLRPILDDATDLFPRRVFFRSVPFCQSDAGCPISNVIPKWNDLVFKGQWKDALYRLLLTNNFPE